MSSFHIIESEQILKNHINYAKELYGVRRKSLIRNVTLIEDRLRPYNYPILAAIQASVDHRKTFHTVSIICPRYTAKKLVYWKTSKNCPISDRSSFMFYIMKDRDDLTEYLNKSGEDFYRVVDELAGRAEGCKLTTDDRSFNAAHSGAIKFMERSEGPIMIASLKVGIKHNDRHDDREDKVKYFLKHYFIQLSEAKKLVHWKKNNPQKIKDDLIKNKLTKNKLDYKFGDYLYEREVQLQDGTRPQPTNNYASNYGRSSASERGEDRPNNPEVGLVEATPRYNPDRHGRPVVAEHEEDRLAGTPAASMRVSGTYANTRDDREVYRADVERVERDIVGRHENDENVRGVRKVDLVGVVEEIIERRENDENTEEVERTQEEIDDREDEARDNENKVINRNPTILSVPSALNVVGEGEAEVQRVDSTPTAGTVSGRIVEEVISDRIVERPRDLEDWQEIDRAMDRYKARSLDEVSEDTRDDEASEDNRDIEEEEEA